MSNGDNAELYEFLWNGGAALMEREIIADDHIRKALRRPEVLLATGWSVPTLYRKMKDRRFPQSQKLDPLGQTVIWFADEVAAWQRGEWKPEEAAASLVNKIGGFSPNIPRKATWIALLQCDVQIVEYDYCSKIGHLTMAKGCCCDMMGCIAFFKRFDHDVKCICTFSGDVPDTRYECAAGVWKAIKSSWPRPIRDIA